MENNNNRWKRSFITIALGQTISLVGSSAVQFALIWWLASETASPLMLSLAGLLAYLPQLFLGPFAGVWVDRLNRKTVIITADLFIGTIALIFALFFLFRAPPFWSVCVVLGIRAIGSVFHTPAIQAAIPMLVPQDQLVKANGWNQFMQSGAFMLGPVLGAAMYTALPMHIILITDFIGAIIACTAVAIINIPNPPQHEHAERHFIKEIKEGISIFLSDRRLSIVTLSATICMIFSMPLSSFYPLMTSDYFKGTAWHASVVEIAYAGGMMLCSIIVSRWSNIKNKFLIIHLGLFGLGLACLLCGLIPPNISLFWYFMILCGLMGASSNLYSIPYIAYMQENIPRNAQGRAFSLMGSLMSFAMPVGLLIAGPVAEVIGVHFWFLISGIAFFIITSISAMLTLPKNRAENNKI